MTASKLQAVVQSRTAGTDSPLSLGRHLLVSSTFRVRSCLSRLWAMRPGPCHAWSAQL